MDTPIAVFSGTVRIVVPYAAVAETAAAMPRRVRGTVTCQPCDDVSCYPPQTLPFQLTVPAAAPPLPQPRGETATAGPVAAETPAAPQLPAAAAAVPAELPASTPGLPVMLLLALGGGVLLNFMPCVLTVLSLKVLGLVRQAQESRGRAAALGVAYTLGVLASFWLIAGLVLALRAAGHGVGWGFQFQNPHFVAVMSAIITAVGVNLFGVFEVQLPGAAAAGMAQAASREGLPGAFLSGAFATLLATPCTAPLLGAAMGFAFTQSASVLLAVFTAAALGLALPFLILTLLPAARRLMPKPGAWMIIFKQAMAFLMLATLPWLWYVLGRQTTTLAMAVLAGWNLLIALALWAMAQAGGLTAPAARRWLARTLAVMLIIASYGLVVQPTLARMPAAADKAGDDRWLPYDAAQLAALRAEGKSIFLVATADWCMTCKVNEQAVLNTAATAALFQRHGLVLMRADWTRADPAITALLRSHGRAGVPFYALFRGEREPVILPELLTYELLARAVDGDRDR